MELGTLEQSIAASIAANAAIEAAKITAQATIEASKNTFYAALVAITAASATVVAAYVNTYQSRQTYKAERNAYRYLIGGLVQACLDEIGFTWLRMNQALNDLENEDPGLLSINRIDLPEELSNEHWKQHAMLGSRFGRDIVKFRDKLESHNQFCDSHQNGWDLSVPSRGLMPNNAILKFRTQSIAELVEISERMVASTMTLFERTRSKLGRWGYTIRALWPGQ
jgi:hypothetical protein